MVWTPVFPSRAIISACLTRSSALPQTGNTHILYNDIKSSAPDVTCLHTRAPHAFTALLLHHTLGGDILTVANE